MPTNHFFKRTALVCSLISFSYLLSAQTPLQQFLRNPALKHASVGVNVADLSRGKTLLSHNADKSLTPASVQKLITTAVATEILGADFCYTTLVALDKDDPSRILVIGSGDPTLGSSVFDDNPDAFFIHCASELRRKLPADKKYSVYVVDNRFGYMGISPEWTWVDMGNYYASGAYGISIFDNTYKLFFNTTSRNVCPQIIRTEPAIKGLTFDNYLTLNTLGQDNGYIYGMPFSYERSLRGDIPAGRAEFSIKGDIPDPGLLLGETMADYLRRSGFEIEKVETSRRDYVSRLCETDKTQPYKIGTPLFEYRSRPMSEMIREINVQSNNHYAEHLIRTVGRTRNTDIYSDALQEGINAIDLFWKSKGIDTKALTMYDGCGLAPQNAISPKFLTDLLAYMYAGKNSAVFFDSLPKAGEEGTVRSFMTNTAYKGIIRMKSGSIGGVQCYAGYLVSGDKKLVFSVMVNKFNGTRAEVRRAIEKLLSSL
ncbi:MAG: D-alanyl-D-alanine carboxypeptidase/D-alanyl-D-alanine-endopeptidase [Dysgonamonadaceae bacterium]|jgi:D-alanyl-D-alanine carboxypeptidase/D-alanyl-D-alanine-endopeptidase (penicillin-binding protein 4)|nr:D-alanyl-D-alanine carboxypeptidase/D-alanyl-D-alanine-endopeptidase [Dysgonamonadaceae bacterium]